MKQERAKRAVIVIGAASEHSASRSGMKALSIRLCAALALAAVLLVAPGADAQKKKKNSDKDAAAAEATITLPDPQQIEKEISEMLAAWQIGDVEMLKKYHADSVTVVSSAYEPPLQGWASYAQAYQRQRSRMELVRVDRRNTFIHVKGLVAWAVYQWEMTATADGSPYGARGHTSLTLEKRGNFWVIAHNHTSIVETAKPQAETQLQPAASTPPGGGESRR
ncbi:MAG: YybH family protein [Candidatus Acidiferrales bacterium]